MEDVFKEQITSYAVTYCFDFYPECFEQINTLNLVWDRMFITLDRDEFYVHFIMLCALLNFDIDQFISIMDQDIVPELGIVVNQAVTELEPKQSRKLCKKSVNHINNNPGTLSRSYLSCDASLNSSVLTDDVKKSVTSKNVDDYSMTLQTTHVSCEAEVKSCNDDDCQSSQPVGY